MRSFLQSRTVIRAAVAAGLTTLACWPRMALWVDRRASIPLLLLGIWWTASFMWGFILAWHERETGRKVFQFRIPLALMGWTTLAGVGVALATRQWIDPLVNAFTPTVLPHNLAEWLAMTLFTAGFEQIFACYAAFAVLLRLSHRPKIAFVLLVLLWTLTFGLKLSSLPSVPSFGLAADLWAGRVIANSLCLVCYLRGGFLLASWWTLLLQARYLLDLAGS